MSGITCLLYIVSYVFLLIFKLLYLTNLFYHLFYRSGMELYNVVYFLLKNVISFAADNVHF